MLACGQNGRGAAEKFGVEDRIPIDLRHIFESVWRLGGFVAGSKDTLEYLRFYAHPYVYSCALPPVVVAAILKALEIGIAQPELRTQLWENADYFHRNLRGLGIDTGTSTTYIMPIVIGERERMYRIGHELRRRGLWVAPVDYPAVPLNRTCFRACVTAKHTRADLDEALNILADTARSGSKLRAPKLYGRVHLNAQEVEPALSPLEATFKAREVEGILDIYFYRRVGFQLARIFRAL